MSSPRATCQPHAHRGAHQHGGDGAAVARPNLFGVVVRSIGARSRISKIHDQACGGLSCWRQDPGRDRAGDQDRRCDHRRARRPDGRALHEPSRPRATPAAATATPPSVAPALPGVIPPAAPAPGPSQAAQPSPQPVQPGMMPPGQPPVGQPPVVGGPANPASPHRSFQAGGRSPPNLLRRLPPGMGDAPQQ